MPIVNYTVTRRGRQWIGDAVAHAIGEARRAHPDAAVVAVVPRMLTYFSSAPERYEVTEVDLLMEVPHE